MLPLPPHSPPCLCRKFPFRPHLRLHGLTPAHICAGTEWAHPRPHLSRQSPPRTEPGLPGLTPATSAPGLPGLTPAPTGLGLGWAAAYSSILNLKLFRNSYGGDAALRQIAAAGDADQQLQATLVLS